MIVRGLVLSLLPLTVWADLLDFETDQLTDRDAERYPSLRFGEISDKADEAGRKGSSYLGGGSRGGGGKGGGGRGGGRYGSRDGRRDEADCKAWPDTDSWPDGDDWDELSDALGGALLHPLPTAHVCYDGPTYDEEQCRFLVEEADRSHFWVDEPLVTLTQWPQGNTCRPTLETEGKTCTRGGYPEYVVNATSVKHVQAAINFARNNDVRLVIKNTGHDFGGRNIGAGSVSIWTHQFKDFKFIPDYKQGEYSGMAVQYGSGLETWELFGHMADNDIAVPAAGGRTVGANGGWFATGGHGNLASYYGLGADQALEIHVVTADGRLVVAAPDRNEDLFFALRGGGPSTYGVVTSVVMKAYPPIDVARATVTFQTNSRDPADADLLSVDGSDRFWDGLATYFRFERAIVDAGGVDWNYIYPRGGDAYMFRCFITLPGKTSSEASELLRPLYEDLNDLGIDIPIPETFQTSPYASAPRGGGGAPAEPLADTRYRSRLFPRRNWDDARLFASTMAAVRSAVEANYTFHGLAIAPTEDVAGWPGKTAAVNPAWRRNILHAILIGEQAAGLTPQQAREEEARIQLHMKEWRAVSPGAGSYMNEGDPGEPNWQQAFYGSNYRELLQVKVERDPWSLFWAPTTVGSELWEVRTQDGYPRSQNGRLCRAM